MIAPPPGLRIEPWYPAPQPDPIWLPPRLRRRMPGERLVVPPDLKKIIYYKGRLHKTDPSSDTDTRWVWDTRRCPYDYDIDAPGNDNLSLRDHIHLWLTGKLELLPGGAFVHQDSDERYHTTVIEEHPAALHTWDRFSRFLKRER